MSKKTRIGRKILSLLLTAVMLFTVQGISVWAETVGNNINLESAGGRVTHESGASLHEKG